MPLAVVYAGTPEFAVPALEAIVDAGHVVRAVYSQPDRPAGRGRALTASAVKRRALEIGLIVRQPAALGDEVGAQLAALAADVMVVAAYGLVLPAAILALPRLGCVNIHASLLPRWRGAAPIQRALQAGDPVTGVSIMRMTPGLDTGPVYATVPVGITAHDTTASLAGRLALQGAAALLATLTRLEQGGAVAVPQPAAGVCYAHKLQKAEAPLDWSRAAVDLDRQVRAFVPWPVAQTLWHGTPLRVHEALPVEAAVAAAAGTIVAAGPSGIDVATGAGVLRILRAQLAGRDIVTGAELAAAAARRGPVIGVVLGPAA